jgi:prepilin-type N-terminal cleavage/methylation domain-containing protein
MIKTSTKNYLSRGFTIVEMIVVIVVIGILATIILVSYGWVQNEARKASLMSDLKSAVSTLELDLKHDSSYPATVALADHGSGLAASPGTTYQYVVSNTSTPKLYCLTATQGSQSYNINQDNILSPGVCPSFSFDAASPTAYPGTGITTLDLSASGNTGTLVNGVGYTNVNKGALVFDGIDDRLQTATVHTYGNNTTWSAWIYCTQDISSINMFMGRVLPYFGMYAGNSMFFSNNIGGTQRSLRSSATLTLNTWYYVAFTTQYDGTSTTMTIYINGVKSTLNSWAGSQVNYDYKFAIGDGRIATVWYPFKGMVSDVKIYEHTLSVDEVKQYFDFTRSRYGL